MATYGGDEVGAIVVDVGTAYTRCGFAGVDHPFTFHSLVSRDKAVVGKAAADTGDGSAMEVDTPGASTPADAPTAVTSEATDERVESRAARKAKTVRVFEPCTPAVKDDKDITSPCKDGMIEDWDSFEAIMDHIYDNCLHIASKDHPVIMLEAAWNPQDKREKMCELMFEKYNIPAYWTSKRAVVSSFATSRATALVVDSGASGTSVVPVYDGYALTSAVVRNSVGGNTLTQMYREFFEKAHGQIVPTYMVKSKNPVKEGEPASFTQRDIPHVHPTFHSLCVDDLVHQFKQETAQVSALAYDQARDEQIPFATFEFPNGFSQSVGPERFQVSEALFDPTNYAPPAMRPTTESGASISGVVDMIVESIQKCDMDVRQSLYNNIVLTGGNSLLSGFAERVNSELELKGQAGGRFKTYASSFTVERHHSAWIGGSILGSAGTFQQMWISRAEYDEAGTSRVR